MSGQIPTHGGTDERSAAPIVEIVSAGNEVLIGDVLDTNTNWLCVKVTGMGGLVRRTVMLRDDIRAIAAEIRGALERRPALVFTVGGLGPTSDDRTLEGVALGLGVELRLHPEAEEAQEGLQKHDGGDRQGRVDNDGPEDVRDDVAEDDPPAAVA